MGSLFEGLTNKSGSNTSPSMATNPNVVLPPGVDPYYGITISTLPGASIAGEDSDNSSNPFDIFGRTSGRSTSNTSTGGSRYYPSYNDRGVQKLDIKALQDAYKNRPDRPAGVPSGATYDPQSGRWVSFTFDPNTNSMREEYFGEPSWRSGTNTNTGGTVRGGGMRIAKPNMTWVNGMPSVMPAGGGSLAQLYGPFPFSQGANTPMPTPIPRQLTYNNPYNTNPYLPLANPFALIANTQSSGS